MKKEGYTILCPQMSPLHWALVEWKPAIRSEAIIWWFWTMTTVPVIDDTDQYVTTTPATPPLSVGQEVMSSLSRKILIWKRQRLLCPRPEEGCRASNYIGFIQSFALWQGMGHLANSSLFLKCQRYESTPGFACMTIPLLTKAIGIVYETFGVSFRHCPYELQEGSAEALHQKWKKICQKVFSKKNILFLHGVWKNVRVLEIWLLFTTEHQKPKVGIVGEILSKVLPSCCLSQPYCRAFGKGRRWSLCNAGSYGLPALLLL